MIQRLSSWPSISVEIYALMTIERDAFPLEEGSLDPLEGDSGGSLAHLASGVHDAMPGHVVLVGKGRHGVAHLAGAPR
jgi:hypothetical protein